STLARTRPHPSSTPTPPSAPTNPGLVLPHATTGRYLVLLREDQFEQGIATLKSKAGLHAVASTADYEAGDIEMKEAGESDIIVFDRLKIATVKADPSQASALSAAAAEANTVLAVEAEQILHTCTDIRQPIGPATGSMEYLRGYHDAVTHLH